MDCGQIEKILKNCPITTPIFRACVEVSNLSYSLKSLYIPGQANIFILLDVPKNQNLGHFVLLFCDKNNRVILFDSAGNNQINNEIKVALKTSIGVNEVQLNQKRIQSPNSCTCGLYCIFYSIVSFNLLLKLFYFLIKL